MILALKFKVRKKFFCKKHNRQQTLYAHISPKSQATEVKISSTTTMKPTRRATTTLSYNIDPNEIILKNPSAEKKQISAVSEITATVASLAIDGSVERKQIALFIFES